MIILAKYGAAFTLDGVPLITRGAVDYKANPTLASGDAKISKDGGSEANLTTLPSVTPTSSTLVRIALSATEMQAARVVVTLVDQGTKEWEDQRIVIHTFGHASAMYPVDLSDAVRLGMTALPNANAEAPGGLFTRGSGAGQINQAANGQIDANTVGVEGVDATNQIRDAILNDATRFAGADIGTIKTQTDTVEASLATALSNLTTIIGQTDSVEGSLTTALADIASVLTAVTSKRTIGGAAGIDGSGTVRVNVYLNTYTGAVVDCTACTLELLDETGATVIGTGAWTTGPTENADTSWTATKTSVSTSAGKVYRVKATLTHGGTPYIRFIDLNAVA